MRPLRLGQGTARASDRHSVQLRTARALRAATRSATSSRSSMDPNVSIHEAKTITCTIRPGPARGCVTSRGAIDAGPAARAHDSSASRSAHGIDMEAADADGERVLHRHDALHRLQGLRGRVQTVEPAAGRRLRVLRQLVRQHDGARRHDVASRRVRRAGRAADAQPPTRALADDERRVQALHARRLHGSVSDRRDHPQRVRRRLHPARRLQRLRLLRAVVPVRRRRPDRAPPTTTRRALRLGRPHERRRDCSSTAASPASARCATTGRSSASCRPAPRRVRPNRFSSATSTSCKTRARKRRRDLAERAASMRISTASTRRRRSATSTRSSCSPSGPRRTTCPSARCCRRRASRPATRAAALAAAALALAGCADLRAAAR